MQYVVGSVKIALPLALVEANSSKTLVSNISIWFNVYSSTPILYIRSTSVYSTIIYEKCEGSQHVN